MKSIIKQSILIFTLSIAFTSASYAQKENKAAYLISAKSKSTGLKLHGKLVAINDTALVIADKKNVLHYMAFSKASFIRVDKNRSDVGFGILTGAAVAGNILLAATLEDPAAVILVGAGGTVGVVVIMSVIHGIIHPAELKMTSKRDTFTHDVLAQKLNPYLAKITPVNP